MSMRGSLERLVCWGQYQEFRLAVVAARIPEGALRPAVATLLFVTGVKLAARKSQAGSQRSAQLWAADLFVPS